MKKLILPIILLALLIPIPPNSLDKVNAAEPGGSITCEEAKNNVIGKPSCEYWAIGLHRDYKDGLWCSSDAGYFSRTDENGRLAFVNEAPKYFPITGDEPCLNELSEKQGTTAQQDSTSQSAPTSSTPVAEPASDQPDKINQPQQAQKNETDLQGGKLPVFIGEWVDLISSTVFWNNLFFEHASYLLTGQSVEGERETAKDLKYIDSLTDEYLFYATGRPRDYLEELIDRDPDISDEIVDQLKQKVQDSPYTLDILKGQAQIRYPGKSPWSALKEGDKIPPGSTVFTGMDTTTILNIRGQGVVEILPFTEVTIDEVGLEQAEYEGKTSTDIYLRKGEIEVDIEPYVPTAPSGSSNSQGRGMSIYGPFYAAAVKGTHFWVKQEEGKRVAIIGVYEGEVEVKTKGSSEPVFVSPDGDKPGVVLIVSKLSIPKLLVSAVVLVMAVLVAFLLLKRRGLNTKLSKRK